MKSSPKSKSWKDANESLKRLLDEDRLIMFISFVENNARVSGFFTGVVVGVVSLMLGFWMAGSS